MDYNVGMKTNQQGDKKRWTVVNVPTRISNRVVTYAALNGLKVGRALAEFVDTSNLDSFKQSLDKQKIGLDYWQVISHYEDYFREFAKLMIEAGHEIYIISAVGKNREATVFNDIDKTHVPYTEKYKVVFNDPKESPELKLAKCKELGITTFYDDRDDVCRLLNANGILALRVTRKDNSTYDLGAEIK